MAGFFKKLFNRITGKSTEEAKPELTEPVALPAPEPEVAAASPPPQKPKVDSRPQRNDAAKGKTKAAPPSKAALKKPKPNKPTLKKVEAKKVEPVKAPAKKPELKKSEAKQPAPKTKAKLVATPATLPPPVVKSAAPPVVPVEFPPPPPVAKPQTPAPVLVAEAQRSGGWFTRLRDGLSKTSKSVAGNITAIFTKKKLDNETLQELEDTLIQADLGLAVSERIVAAVSHGRYDKEVDPEEVKQILASEVAKVLKPVEVPFNFGSEKPFVIVVVGVNGSGKTTTIGKLGAIAAGEGYKVMFAAGDTFRAAAIEQLTVWGKRIGAETISRPTGADAAGLAFDALKEAQSNGTDILFIDTAGRLQNKVHLMDELDKMVRVIKKLDPTAPHAVLLVLDATTGQNALSQAEIFTKVAGVTGLIMTKLDGTARGGILVAIAEKFKLPIHAIGVGESIDDLQPFHAEGFARAIAGLDEK